MNSQLGYNQLEAIEEKCRQMRSEIVYDSLVSTLNGLRIKIARIVAPKYVIISRVDHEIAGAAAH